MNCSFRPVFKGGKALSYCALALAAGLLASISQAQIVNLSSGNSTASVNLGTQAGMNSWNINGVNQLNQQWFWVRNDNDPTGQHSLDTLPHTFTSSANSLSATYMASAYTINISYQLLGGATGGTDWHSEITESISLQNTSGGALNLHFFQYSDFDIGGPGGDTVQLGRNLRGLFNEAAQSDPFAGITETVVTPGANHGEVALQGATLAKLNNAGPDNLNDFDGGPGGLGPGDVTWALQWDLLIPGGSSAIISKDKNLNILVIPEPSSIALIAIGLAGCSIWRRRRSA